MKILTTYEAKNAFPKVLKLSQMDVVIVTNPVNRSVPSRVSKAKMIWRTIS